MAVLGLMYLQPAVNMFETPHSRWRALEMRNPRAASAFLYGVKTTHIYCRPTCPSRLARKANVVFFDSANEAECAGFRACKRCKPSQADFEPQASHKKAFRKACELMDAAEGVLTLESLAASVGLSPRYLHGVFKTVMGFTPNAYAMRVRKEGSSRKGLSSQERAAAFLQDGGPPPSREVDEGTASPYLSFIDLPLDGDTEAGPASPGTPSYRHTGNRCQYTAPVPSTGIFDDFPLCFEEYFDVSPLWDPSCLNYGVIATHGAGDVSPIDNIIGTQGEDAFRMMLTDQPGHLNCCSNSRNLDSD
ncbi:metal binding domain of Ada-domain-containing protein [Chaetomium tenue]|uniref:Metal binding domain of Ada-domain-containing protein n=1 Tax=Chaetomium tenue TaxID=1854479 RepID=A0ACB7PP59_9PEZI|nr:metal binding domain of Ada-domain-containing protein [Chaetomium globosum]